MSERLAFDAVANFRDFGGYAVAGGGRMRSGLLYRSAHLAQASDADLARLAELGVAIIVDLRRLVEREVEPGRRPPGYAGAVIENDIEEEGLSPESIPGRISQGVEAFRERSRGFYRRAAFDPRHIDLFRRYFQTLAGGTGPILIHCASGKDRTGLLCALTHRLAGVGDDDLMADYLATNALMGGRLPFFREAALKATGRMFSDAELLTYIQIGPDYLNAAFGAMAERCGSVEGYMAQVLGLDAGLRAQLHERLVA